MLERVTVKIYCAYCIEQGRIQNVNYAVKQYRYPQYKQYNIDIHQKTKVGQTMKQCLSKFCILDYINRDSLLKIM